MIEKELNDDFLTCFRLLKECYAKRFDNFRMLSYKLARFQDTLSEEEKRSLEDCLESETMSMHCFELAMCCVQQCAPITDGKNYPYQFPYGHQCEILTDHWIPAGIKPETHDGRIRQSLLVTLEGEEGKRITTMASFNNAESEWDEIYINPSFGYKLIAWRNLPQPYTPPKFYFTHGPFDAIPEKEGKYYCYDCIYHMHPGELPPSDIKQVRTRCGNLDSPYYGQIVSITHACDCGVPFATGGFVDKIQIVPTDPEKER